MVLTNFECWAHGETAGAVDFENGPGARHPAMADPFNRRVVSHIASASNGYYGYAIVNNDAAAAAAAGAADNNNNNTCNNNNNTVQAAAMEVNSIDAASARCKKRCFAMGGHNDHELDMEMDNLTAVKRCRFDDADLMAQYCNDFFSLPATQVIGTQACLMDYDYNLQQQQHQQLQHHQQQQQQQQSQPMALQQQHPRIHQHYQDGPQREQEQEQEQQLPIEDKLDDKIEAAADLYIATHGGCRHHYPCRPVETDEEFDI